MEHNKNLYAFALTPWTVPPRSLNAGNDWRFSCFWLLWLYFGSEKEGYQSLSPDLFRFSAGDKGGGFARGCNAPKEAARDRSLAARSGHHFAMPDRHRIALQWPSSRIVCALPLEILFDA
jgi:hypothetical protein